MKVHLQKKCVYGMAHATGDVLLMIGQTHSESQDKELL